MITRIEGELDEKSGLDTCIQPQLTLVQELRIAGSTLIIMPTHNKPAPYQQMYANEAAHILSSMNC